MPKILHRWSRKPRFWRRNSSDEQYECRKWEFCNFPEATEPEVDEYGIARWGGTRHTHRIDGPARVTAGGGEVWLQHGVNHRLLKPAITSNVDDLQSEILFGFQKWYYRGVFHRFDGPAAMNDVRLEWYHYDKMHRLDGPASINISGEVSWCVRGIEQPPKD